MCSTESHKGKKHLLTEHLEQSKTSLFQMLYNAFLFEEFIEGPTNKLAFDTCEAIVGQLGDSKHNPLFLYGASELGKTHLIQAVGQAVLDRSPNARVMYLTAAQIVAEFADASQQQQQIEQLNLGCRDLDLLLIDDFEFLVGKSSHLDNFFRIVNELFKESKQIIIASNLYPQEIVELDARLLSQLPRALFIEVQPPELENRVDILLRYSKLHQYELSHDFALCIAQQVIGNVNELEDALNQVIAAAKIHGTAINIKVIKETLKDKFTLRVKKD